MAAVLDMWPLTVSAWIFAGIAGYITALLLLTLASARDPGDLSDDVIRGMACGARLAIVLWTWAGAVYAARHIL